MHGQQLCEYRIGEYRGPNLIEKHTIGEEEVGSPQIRALVYTFS